MKRMILLIGIMLVFTACTKRVETVGDSKHIDQEKGVEEWIKEGDEAKELDEKLKCYTHALDLKPDDVEIRVRLGNVYLNKKGMLDEAIVEYEKIISQKPEHFWAHNNLGIAYDKKGEWDKAISAYKKAIAVKSDIAAPYCNLGLVYKKQGKFEVAALVMRQAIAVDPQNALTHYNLGTLYAEEGLLDDAIPVFKKALSIKPGFSRARYDLGLVYGKMEMVDAAIAEFKKVIAKYPDYADVHYSIAHEYMKKERSNLAAEHFYKAGLLYLKQEKRDKALESYEALKQTKSEKYEQILYEKLYSEEKKGKK